MPTYSRGRADKVRAYYARRRRRILQNRQAFITAGYVPPSGALFDVGNTSVSSISPNGLILPADVDVSLTVAGLPVAAEMFGIHDATSGETFLNAVPVESGYTIHIRSIFREGHTIHLARETDPVATVAVFFRGPKDLITQFGIGQLTA